MIKSFYVLLVSCWSYKAYKPTLVTICNTKRWSICSICVKMGKIIYYTELSYNSCCYVVKAQGLHASPFCNNDRLLSGLICLWIIGRFLAHVWSNKWTNVEGMQLKWVNVPQDKGRDMYIRKLLLLCSVCESPSGMCRDAWWEPRPYKNVILFSGFGQISVCALRANILV